MIYTVRTFNSETKQWTVRYQSPIRSKAREHFDSIKKAINPGYTNVVLDDGVDCSVKKTLVPDEMPT